jgi:hypothetical protein
MNNWLRNIGSFTLCLISLGPGESLALENVCSKASPMTKNVLVELFTSDGCDSCPPANRWLSSAVAGSDKSLIPVSLHVTYWNHLGWNDEFSSERFDARQEAYARQAINKFAYTPELFLNAREWRGWKNGDRAEIASAGKQIAPVSIALAARQSEKGGVIVETSIKAADGGGKIDLSSSRLYLLLYEDELIERPNAGELKNAVLKHDHVVRDWKITETIDANRAISSVFRIPAQWNERKMGVVAFVQSKDLKSIHQAIDLPFCF